MKKNEGDMKRTLKGYGFENLECLKQIYYGKGSTDSVKFPSRFEGRFHLLENRMLKFICHHKRS